MSEAATATRVLGLDGIDALLRALHEDGFRVIGPTIREGAIVLEEIAGADALPHGWTEEQEAATYRLVRRDDAAVFGFATTPHAWKRWLHPARVRLWTARPDGDGAPTFEEEPPPDRPLALVGVRSCDLHAIAIQDRVFLGGRYPERDYASRREGAFVVAVDCGEPGGTCFCASLGTGPRVGEGADLVLTELDPGTSFLVRSGSERGEALLARLPGRDAAPADLATAQAVTDGAAHRMGRALETDGLHDALLANLDHPRYDEVAERCLTCANCTLVCPTCFCTSVDDVNALDGSAESWRQWDSCFSIDYSYIHGGSVRQAPRARYRQWLTHKFATWIDQFGSSGCVGCGRCITWCPVGIDVTEELAAIRATEGEVDRAEAR